MKKFDLSNKQISDGLTSAYHNNQISAIKIIYTEIIKPNNKLEKLSRDLTFVCLANCDLEMIRFLSTYISFNSLRCRDNLHHIAKAISNDCVDIIEILFNKGISNIIKDIPYDNYYGTKPFTRFIYYAKSVEMIKLLLANGSELDSDVLFNVCEHGNLDAIRYIHSQGVNVDRKFSELIIFTKYDRKPNYHLDDNVLFLLRELYTIETIVEGMLSFYDKCESSISIFSDILENILRFAYCTISWDFKVRYSPELIKTFDTYYKYKINLENDLKRRNQVLSINRDSTSSSPLDIQLKILEDMINLN